MKPIIICLGRPRCGSTLQYNIVKSLLEQTIGVRCGGSFTEPEASKIIEKESRGPESSGEGQKPYLFKSHYVDLKTLHEYREKILILTIYRDYRDVFLSFKEKNNLYIEDFLENYKKWTPYFKNIENKYAGLVQCYEAVYFDQEHAIREIGAALGCNLEKKTIVKTLSETSLSVMQKKSKKVPMWHKINYLGNEIIHSLPFRWRKGLSGITIIRKFRSVLFNSNLEEPNTLLHYNHISKFKGKPGSWKHGLNNEEIKRLSKMGHR